MDFVDQTGRSLTGLKYNIRFGKGRCTFREAVRELFERFQAVDGAGNLSHPELYVPMLCLFDSDSLGFLALAASLNCYTINSAVLYVHVLCNSHCLFCCITRTTSIRRRKEGLTKFSRVSNERTEIWLQLCREGEGLIAFICNRLDMPGSAKDQPGTGYVALEKWVEKGQRESVVTKLYGVTEYGFSNSVRQTWYPSRYRSCYRATVCGMHTHTALSATNGTLLCIFQSFSCSLSCSLKHPPAFNLDSVYCTV